MNEIPSIWRTELWHALSVHFPIALLIFATLTTVAGAFLKNSARFTFLKNTTSLLLWAGSISIWIAIYTGTEAYNVVVRTICDPGVLQQHDQWGYIAAILFSAAAGFDILQKLKILKSSKFIYLAVLMLMLGGSASLIYVGHLGAKVVYQQAGGVYVPSGNCNEFE